MKGPSPLREVKKIPEHSLRAEFWWVFAVTKGFFFCCYEGCYEAVVTVVVTRAVTRVEQKVVEAANVSLLALHKEGKSDPNPPPWTPAIHHTSSTTNLESHT